MAHSTNQAWFHIKAKDKWWTGNVWSDSSDFAKRYEFTAAETLIAKRWSKGARIGVTRSSHGMIQILATPIIVPHTQP